MPDRPESRRHWVTLFCVECRAAVSAEHELVLCGCGARQVVTSPVVALLNASLYTAPPPAHQVFPVDLGAPDA